MATFRAALIAAAFVTVVWAASPTLAGDCTVRVATLLDYPPFCFCLDEPSSLRQETIPPGQDSKVIQGYSWDVVRKSFHAMGCTVKLSLAPWSRVKRYIDQDRVDAGFPAIVTPERERSYLFSAESVDEAGFVVYVLHDSLLEWTGPKSLKGLRLAVVKDWAYGDLDQVPTIRVLAYTLGEAFDKLLSGKVDAVACYEPACSWELDRAGLSMEGFRRLGPYQRLPEFMMGRKGSSESRRALDLFDRGRKAISEDGVLKNIQLRWFGR